RRGSAPRPGSPQARAVRRSAGSDEGGARSRRDRAASFGAGGERRSRLVPFLAGSAAVVASGVRSGSVLFGRGFRGRRRLLMTGPASGNFGGRLVGAAVALAALVLVL